jgi:hypothetical protein
MVRSLPTKHTHIDVGPQESPCAEALQHPGTLLLGLQQKGCHQIRGNRRPKRGRSRLGCLSAITDRSGLVTRIGESEATEWPSLPPSCPLDRRPHRAQNGRLGTVAEDGTPAISTTYRAVWLERSTPILLMDPWRSANYPNMSKLWSRQSSAQIDPELPECLVAPRH